MHSLTLSIVIETLNLAAGPELDLPAVAKALEQQTYPFEHFEVIVVVDEKNSALSAQVRESFPQFRLLELADPTYFTMKDAGARVASGDLVVMLDSDCVPGPDWARSMVEQFERGADAVAGRTRYARHQPLAATFNFFNFGYIFNDRRGEANSMLPNNCAFRREVYLQHPFDLRIRRSGAAHLLCQQLRARGMKVVYEPRMAATHNSYGISDELLMRIKSGYDVVNLSQLDHEGVMKESRYLRSGPLALFLIFINRIIFDIRLALSQRKQLGLSWLSIPYYCLASPVIRGIELISGLITLAKPDYFRKKFGW